MLNRTTRSNAGRIAAAALATGLGAGVLGAVAPAQAAPTLPDNLKKYANCPVEDPAVSTCIYVQSTAATFTLGKWKLKAESPLTLQFGLKFNRKFKATTVAPTNGAPLFSAPELVVPGGIFGVPGFDGAPFAASGKPEIIGLPQVNIPNLLQQKGVAFKMNLRAKVKNAATDALSDAKGCYIGSVANPIALNLTTGTTAPPAPNKPVTGSKGVTKVDGEPEGGLRFEGVTMRENSFAAPGADNCGPFGSINDIVNMLGNIPSPAGTNDVTFTSNIYQVDANTVRAALGQ